MRPHEGNYDVDCPPDSNYCGDSDEEEDPERLLDVWLGELDSLASVNKLHCCLYWLTIIFNTFFNSRLSPFVNFSCDIHLYIYWYICLYHKTFYKDKNIFRAAAIIIFIFFNHCMDVKLTFLQFFFTNLLFLIEIVRRLN